MVTIRLARHGGKKKPFYHITVAEKTARRDGRFIERVGFYNPVARGQELELRVDLGRVDHWLGVGAQPTERVRQLVAKWRKEGGAEPAPAVESLALEESPAVTESPAVAESPAAAESPAEAEAPVAESPAVAESPETEAAGANDAPSATS